MSEAIFPLKGRRVWVAGHAGMVGRALVRRLEAEDCEILTVSRAALDLRDPGAVSAWLRAERPDAVFLAAARVGGILANASAPVDFLHDNLMIAASVMRAAWAEGVGKLLFLGSSCIYPRAAPQPIREDALMTGPLEPTNRWYALAKIAGVWLGEAYREQYGADFISAMPTNLYGPGDNFGLRTAHVLPALIRKAHEAKLAGARRLTIWGTGKPLREFLFVDDAADACVHLMTHHSDAPPVNVGSGQEIAILDLARLVAHVVGFAGEIATDPAKPDGTPRKRLDTAVMDGLGWRARMPLEKGIETTYRAFLDGDWRDGDRFRIA